MSKKNLELYANIVLNEMAAGTSGGVTEDLLGEGGDGASPTEKDGPGINNFSKLMN